MKRKHIEPIDEAARAAEYLRLGRDYARRVAGPGGESSPLAEQIASQLRRQDEATPGWLGVVR